jgi:phenylalanyl-tRNA synthetase alpha chain
MTTDNTEIKPQELLHSIQNTTSLETLEQQRIQLLGKKGHISLKLKNIASLNPEERKKQGKILNQIKQQLNEAFSQQKDKLSTQALDTKLNTHKPDLSLPVSSKPQGRIHPLRRIIEEMISVLGHMGFSLKEGPDIEEDFFNFSSLNFPPQHPARQMQDTFFLNARDKEGLPKVLRTHTSPVQIRSLVKTKPPLKIIAAGRTFRCDSDQTHAPMFHQVEGLLIDSSTHMGHLKGCLETFCRSIFGVKNLSLRFRPSFFPFTEPSLEVDIRCRRTPEKIIIGEGNEWLEILGCGMVHPQVLKNCGHDPKKFQGFAFGIGVERVAMLKYGIPDLRAFTSGHIPWLQHYGFHATDTPSVGFGLHPLKS